jgi:hypothetical protein
MIKIETTVNSPFSHSRSHIIATWIWIMIQDSSFHANDDTLNIILFLVCLYFCIQGSWAMLTTASSPTCPTQASTIFRTLTFSRYSVSIAILLMSACVAVMSLASLMWSRPTIQELVPLLWQQSTRLKTLYKCHIQVSDPYVCVCVCVCVCICV